MLVLVHFFLMFGDLLLSWRFHLGLALTAVMCWLA